MVKETIIIEGKVNSDEVQDEFKDIQKEVNKTTKSVDEFSDKAKKDLKTVEKESKKAGKGVRLINKGFKALGTAMKGAGIGLIVGALALMAKAFTENQKIVDAVSKAFETVNILFKQVSEAVMSAYNAATEATGGFDALKKVMSGLLTIALTPMKVAFYGIKLGVKEAQLAWEQSFFGDKDQETIKNLNAEILETKMQLGGVALEAIQAGKDVANNFKEAVNEVSTLTTTTVEKLGDVSVATAKAQASQLIELRKAAALADGQLTALTLKYQRQAEEQRQIRDDVSKSIEERIKANNRLGEILEKQSNEELKVAQQKLTLARAELKLNPDRIDLINQEQEALNGIAEVRERITGQTSEQLVNETALRDERRANLQELKLIGLTQQELAEQELQNTLENQQALIERTVENEAEKNRLLLAAKTEYDNALIELNKEYAKKDQAIDDETTKKKKENEQSVLTAKINIARNTLGMIADMAGKGSKIAKAVGVAQTIISSIEGVQNAYTSAQKSPITALFPAYPAVQAGLAGVFGALQVAKIKSANVPSISANSIPSGSGGGVSSTVGQQAQAPSFNLVGDTGTNQIAGVLGQNAGRPVEAYVVSRKMSSQQELDRNIINNASLR